MGGWGRGEAAAPKPFLTTNEFSDVLSKCTMNNGALQSLPPPG
jgi:hypothetical protein